MASVCLYQNSTLNPSPVWCALMWSEAAVIWLVPSCCLSYWMAQMCVSDYGSHEWPAAVLHINLRDFSSPPVNCIYTHCVVCVWQWTNNFAFKCINWKLCIIMINSNKGIFRILCTRLVREETFSFLSSSLDLLAKNMQRTKWQFLILWQFDLTENDLYSSDVFLMQHCNQMMKLITVVMAVRQNRSISKDIFESLLRRRCQTVTALKQLFLEIVRALYLIMRREC